MSRSAGRNVGSNSTTGLSRVSAPPGRTSSTTRAAVHTFVIEAVCIPLSGMEFPKAVAKITGDADEQLAFYDYAASSGPPAQRPTIESRFSTRAAPHEGHQGTRLARGRAGHGVQLIESAQARWRAVRPTRRPRPRRCTRRQRKIVEHPDDHAAPTAT